MGVCVRACVFAGAGVGAGAWRNGLARHSEGGGQYKKEIERSRPRKGQRQAARQ